MNTRSNNKILIAIIIFLVLTNLLVLGYFLLNKKPGGKGGRDGKDMFATSLQKEVGFSDQQVNQFKALKDVNWADAKKRMDEIRQLKLKMYDMVRQPTVSDSALNQMADSIGKLQKEVEINAFKHFKQTRSICTPEQLPAFDSLMIKIISKPGRGKKSGPDGDRRKK